MDARMVAMVIADVILYDALDVADIASDEADARSNGVLRRGTSIYYAGSAIFATGIALLTIAVAAIMIFKIHYESDPHQILLTVLFMGVGTVVVLTGVNLVMRQIRYGYPIVGASFCASLLALIIFAYLYPHEWYYPQINYVLTLYTIGTLALFGNIFANAILWLIKNKSVTVSRDRRATKVYTDAEIARDLDEALKKTMAISSSRLNFKTEDAADIRFGNAFHERPGTITRVKDDLHETDRLLSVTNPKITLKASSSEVEDASLLLSETLKKQGTDDEQCGLVKVKPKVVFERVLRLLRLR